MPTHNGERFLSELLESILGQSYRNILLTVRDDGSNDRTCEILHRYTQSSASIKFVQGQKLGAIASFFLLLQNASRNCEYFAFADQDDVWLPEKVERAVLALHRYAKEPAMYCSRLEYVDEGLRHLGYSRIPKRPSFTNALVENIAPGCTVVLNRCARDLICERLPQNPPHHDWWCYLVVSAFGKVIYDERPSIKYRQHANNVIGGTASPWALFERRAARFVKQRNGVRLVSDIAVEFQHCFGDRLSAQDKRTLDRFLSVRGGIADRISYNAAMDVWRQSWVDTLILRAMIVLGRA